MKDNFNLPISGNEHITDFLSKSIKNKKIAGTYIFSGVEDVGKTTAAIYFAKTLLCSNTEVAFACGECDNCQKFEKNNQALNDFYLLKKDLEKQNISIDEVRNFISRMNLGALSGGYKVGIIKDADNMSLEAENALLKTLEEPKNKTVIILTTSSIGKLPKTIVSRSQVLNFFPAKFETLYDFLIEQVGVSRPLAKNLALLSLGRMALARKFFKDKSFFDSYQAQAEIFLKLLSKNAIESMSEIEKISAKAKTKKDYQDALNIWQGVLRDLMFLKFGHKDMIRNQFLIKDLEKHAVRFSPPKLAVLLEKSIKAKDYLSANVNPKNVLEYAVIY